MSFSLKKTAVGVALTGGALFMVHDSLKDDAESREAAYDTLVACADDLGKTGCMEAVDVYKVTPVISVDQNRVTYTYPSSLIIDRADDIRNDEEKYFPLFIYPTTLVVGLGLTAAFQNEKMRRAIAGQF